MNKGKLLEHLISEMNTIEDQDESGAYFSKSYDEQGVHHFLSYSVKDLIGETSHKTGKLVIK